MSIFLAARSGHFWSEQGGLYKLDLQTDKFHRALGASIESLSETQLSDELTLLVVGQKKP